MSAQTKRQPGRHFYVVVAVGLIMVAVPLGGNQRAPRPQLRAAMTSDANYAAWNDRHDSVPGEVLIKFRDHVTPAARTQATRVARGGLDPASTRWMGDVLVTRALDEPNADTFAAMLQRQPEVAWAQPNYLRKTSAVPNDPGYTRQWNFDLINVPRAWEIVDGGTDQVVVAVIDTGVATTTETFDFTLWTGRLFETVGIPFRLNPDINPQRITPGYDFVFWDGPVVDMVGHGTHVAGTVLEETNNALAFAGIAHRARLMPLKVCYGYWEMQLAMSSRGVRGFVRPDQEGSCPDSETAQAIRYAADNGAHIINLSLGGPYPSPALHEALRYAVDRGVFVAIAAGNEFEEGNPINYPAKFAGEIDGVVAVGAVGKSGQRAYYSSTGTHVELAAPGGDFRADGLPGVIYQASVLESDFDPSRQIRPRFERYAEVAAQGTSMATPHVVGVAALLYARGVTQPSAIEAALRSTARDLGEPGRDPEYGFGLIDAAAALMFTVPNP